MLLVSEKKRAFLASFLLTPGKTKTTQPKSVVVDSKRRARDSNPQPHYWGTTFPVWPLAIRLPSEKRRTINKPASTYFRV